MILAAAFDIDKTSVFLWTVQKRIWKNDSVGFFYYSVSVCGYWWLNAFTKMFSIVGLF